MSRFLKIMIVLLTIAAVATPVLAEDRLSLSGEMRVRGWHVDVDGADDTQTWADQRMRIAGKLSVAEGVAVNFRFDATEANWGAHPGFGAGRFTSDSNSMQWDRAHLDITKNNWALRAGQQWIAFGKSGFDAQDNGLMFSLKGQVPVSVFMMVDNDGGGKTSSDAYFYGLNAGHKTDSYAANIYAAGQKDNPVDVYMVGVNYATNFDAISLFAELDFFAGDASETADAYGTQLLVDASMAATDTVTVGAQLYYALGDDEDVQYVVLGNDFGGWDPLQAIGTGLDNEQISLGRPFDVLGNGAGLMGGRLYSSLKATDALTLAGSVFFGTADEDAVAEYEDALAVTAGLSYAIMANTKLGLQLQYWDFSAENAPEDLEVVAGGVGLFVNF